MHIKIFGFSLDLVNFCLVNGFIQICDSIYHGVDTFMDFAKNNYTETSYTLRIVFFVLLSLSGACLMYGGKKVS